MTLKQSAKYQAYRRLLRSPGPLAGWLVIWIAGILIALCPSLAPFAAIITAGSAVYLAHSVPSQAAYVKTAMGFFLFWSVFSIFSTLLGLSDFRPPAALAAWLSLGLHLAMLWTPLELGRSWRRLASPLLGRRLSAMTAVGLVVLLKILPQLRLDLKAVNHTQSQRVPAFPLRVRLSLIGRTMVRLSLAKSYDLTRALISR